MKHSDDLKLSKIEEILLLEMKDGMGEIPQYDSYKELELSPFRENAMMFYNFDNGLGKTKEITTLGIWKDNIGERVDENGTLCEPDVYLAFVTGGRINKDDLYVPHPSVVPLSKVLIYHKIDESPSQKESYRITEDNSF